MPNATVCTGPFGDVKQYADGRMYLSWYDAGLLAEGNELAPPRSAAESSAGALDAVRIGTLAALTKFFPEVARLGASAESIEVHAGWVYAIGRGSLADRTSELHRRDQFVLTSRSRLHLGRHGEILDSAVARGTGSAQSLRLTN